MLTARARAALPRLAQRALARCDTLAAHSEENGRLTRTFLCPAMHAVHSDLGAWMRAAGLHVSVDGAGNIIGHFPATRADAPRLLLGSHLDTVPNAGRYDGVLGVLLALAAVESLEGRALPYAVDVVGFSEEEGVRFGVPYIGSLAFTGNLTPTLLARPDAHGTTVTDAIRAYGLDPHAPPAAQHSPHPPLGYVEVHIEQGPVLEQHGLPLGIVEAIAGQTRAFVTLSGQAGHAGTTPMHGRRDALAAAAEWVLAVEHLAQQTPGLVATVGQIEAQPGASNVIPGTATASIDVRHADDPVRCDAVARLQAALQDIGQRRGVSCTWQTVAEQNAVPMDTGLSALLAQAVAAAGYPVQTLASGAGHDAAVLAQAMPAAMLFIRSPGGISHHPDEAVLPGDAEAALRALILLLRLLEQRHS